MDHLNELALPNEKLAKLMDLLVKEMELGLHAATHPTATVKMYPTYVTSLPDGSETGTFLSLDLGGTNFRVLLIKVVKGSIPEEDKPINKIYPIPKSIMTGTGEELFDHIADCIVKFVDEFHVEQTFLPLGFTFSFPCQQFGLTSAKLTQWTKGFSASGVEGEDVVRLLKEALHRKNADKAVGIVALINDTVGCMMSCANKNRNCYIGVILGTGTNACYMETMEKIEMIKDKPIAKTHSEMVINMEWGAFGSNGLLDFLRTKWDKKVDEISINLGKQIYEKMISGMYMGELVRLVLVDLIEDGQLFKGVSIDKGSNPIFKHYEFLTEYVSRFEGQPEASYVESENIMKQLSLENVSKSDLDTIRSVCKAVAERAARLSGAGIAVLLKRLNKPFVTVGIDGTLYRKNPHFHNRMVKTIESLVPTSNKFQLVLSNDGSGLGAAVVAAVASRYKNGHA